MSEAPDPFVSANIDVRDLDGFMLNVERLLASELWALSTPEEFKAAVGLWCRAWKQLPGGSLPNDERVLAAFSGAGARWRKVREMALRGFVLCSDGRLYHKVLCDDVMRAFDHKAAYAADREADRERLRQWREAKRQKHLVRNGDETFSETPVKRVSKPNRNASRNASETSNTGQDRTGQDTKEEEDSEARASGADAPADPVKAIWDHGLAILGNGQRALLGKLRKTYGDPVLLAAIVSCESECPSEPAAFLVACCERSKANGKGSAEHDRAVDILGRAGFEFDERQSRIDPAKAPH